MHILYIHQYFATPEGCTSTRSYEFARRWVRAGHKVTMLTTTAELTQSDLKTAKGNFLKTFSVEGIDVLALNITYGQRMGCIRRCVSFMEFVIASSVVALLVKSVDIIYATSTPLTVGMPALIAKWFRRILFIFEVRDQWPEELIGLGIIKNKILIRTLLWLERLIYKNSSTIIACSPGLADGIKKVCPFDRHIEVIPNNCDTEVFHPGIDGSVIREKNAWEDKLVFLHAGVMGRVNNLDFVIDAAIRLNDKQEILFVLLGEGSQKPLLHRRVEKLHLTNVVILPAAPKRKMPEYFAAADVALVIVEKFPLAEQNSANKFFDGLSAGKPILLNYSGWQRELIEENDAGFGCKICDIDEFVEKILYLNSNRGQLHRMGENARRLAIERFNRDKLATQALAQIELVGG